MKKEKLKNISEIRFGLNAKTNDREGILCLQGKDIEENRIEFKGKIFVDPAKCTTKDYLKPGNVLFSAKGNRHVAAVWNRKEKAVATSTFLILSVNENEILPEYLAWYINQPKTQNYLKQIKKGGTISVVSKKEINDMDVNIPSMESQKKIIRIVNLENREQEILEEIKENRKHLIQGITNKIFQK